MKGELEVLMVSIEVRCLESDLSLKMKDLEQMRDKLLLDKEMDW